MPIRVPLGAVTIEPEPALLRVPLGALTAEVPSVSSTSPAAPSVLETGLKVAFPFVPAAIGVAKGAANSLYGVAEVGGKLLGKPVPPKPAVLEPQGHEEQAGYWLEQLGEFMTPLGVASKAASVVKGASVLPKVARMGLRMAGEGIELASKAAAQSGGDTEDVVTAALLGAATPPVAHAVKAVGKVLTQALPERLYGQVFKLAEDDLRAAYQTAAKGQPVNPTLAKEILDRGLFGSSRNMAIYSFKKLDALESDLQQSLQGKFVKLPQKSDYITLLKGIEDEMGGAFAKAGKEAGLLAKRLQSGIRGPYVSAKDAMTVKRFLDRARQTTSFRMSPKLSPKQDEYKQAADLVRRTIHDALPTASTLLNEERIFIEAVDSLIEDATKRTNRKLLGMTDYLLGGGGMASGFGLSGIGAAAAVRGFQNPFTLTGIGQALSRLKGFGPRPETAGRALTQVTTQVTGE